MMHNPYAPPQAGPPMGHDGQGGPPRGEPLPWEPGEVLEAAWNTYKRHWGPFTAALFVFLLASTVPGQIPNGLVQGGVLEQGSGAQVAVSVVFIVLGWVIQQFFHAGLVRLTIETARHGRVDFAQLFGEGSRFLPFLGLSILQGLLIVLGLIVFIVPGVILSLGLMLSSYFLIDQGLSPIAAMRASWDATVGSKGKLFVLGLLSGLLVIAGILACCVGYFVAGSVTTIATGIVYLRVSGTALPSPMAPPPAPWGPPPGPPGPPGPYGGPANYG